MRIPNEAEPWKGGKMTDLDLIAFLRERFDEEEDAARAAMAEWTEDVTGEFINNEFSEGVWRFLALHDPDQMLRQIAAKRKLLDRFRRATELRSHSGGRKVADKHYPVLGSSLEVLAAVYSDHPDYRAKWLED